MSATSPQCVPQNLSTNLPEIWGWEGWFMVVDIAILVFALARNMIPTDFGLLLALMAPLLAQIVTTSQALAGFASSSVLAVAMLYTVAEAVIATGAMEYVMNTALGRPKSLAMAQATFIVPIMCMSAFLNNTPIVALFVPVIKNWCRQAGFPTAQFMMPLSFAVIMGGTITLIGTSTNMVVSGKSAVYFCKTIPIFALTPYGVPLAFLYASFCILFTSCLLKDRSRAGGGTHQPGDDLLVIHAAVEANSPHIGQQPNALLLEQTDVSMLAFVHRGSQTFAIRSREEGGEESVAKELPTLQAGDILTFHVEHSAVDEFPAFCQTQYFHLVLEEDEDEDASVLTDAVVLQAVIPHASTLEDKTPKEVRFRSLYNAAILTIFREGEKISVSNLGEVILKVGDVLILLTNEKFSWHQSDTQRDLKPRPVATANSPGGSTVVLGGGDPVNYDGVDREFHISMRVTKNSQLQFTRSLEGRNLDQAGMRGLPGLFLVAVTREEQHYYAPGSDFVLHAGDIVWFIGERSSIATLRRMPGLEDVEHEQISKLNIPVLDRRLVEVVLALKSDLIGRTIKESRFRSRFGAAILAIHRGDGKHQTGKELNSIRLRAGDILIVDTGSKFLKQFRDDPNFLIVSEIEDSTPPRFKHFYFAVLLIVLMMILVVVFESEVSLVTLATLVSGLLIFVKTLTPKRARASVNWSVVVTISSAFGLSTALENSLVAPILGNAIVSLSEITNTGEAGVICTVYFATTMLGTVIANNAAALLMFPIAAQAAQKLQVDELKILLSVCFGASASFMTPFGYQTNLMVMEPGYYVFYDYVKYGGIWQIIALFFTCLVLILSDIWYVFIALSVGGFVLALSVKYAVVEGHGWASVFQFLTCQTCRRRLCQSSAKKTKDEETVLPEEEDRERDGQLAL
ncbi:hypothetical protein BASA82_001075 [Batrachochytrium salamandrivorans]|nr:hypothetical protein BASA82_001075 [Batrachochytrium salamandrivorans]